MTIFATTAPAYHVHKLPVIPLYERDKRPIPLDWSRFHQEPVTDQTMQGWIDRHPNSNIGLVLGKQAGVVMLDIDTEDENLSRVIQSVLPNSPWKRVGQKGMVLAFRYAGHRTFRIRDTSGKTLCELLSERTQCVLPPSIHPVTQKPYTANCDLLSVIDNLVPLPEDIEARLRKALQDTGVSLSHSGWTKVTEFVSSGSRDVKLTEMAGLFAYAVLRGERTVAEAIGMLKSYHAEFVENIAGDSIDIEKHVQNLLKFLLRDIQERGKILPKGWDVGLSDEEQQQLRAMFGEEAEEWNVEQLRDHLKEQFDLHAPHTHGRLKAINTVLEKLAKSTTISKIEEDLLLQYISSVSAMDIRMSTLRAQLKELRTGGTIGNDHTEIAQAIIEDIEQLYTLRTHNEAIWKWNGSHWEPFPESQLLAKIANDYGSTNAGKRAHDHRGVLSVIKYLLPQGIKTLDVKGVNFANGFLTEDLKLMEHNPEFGMTYVLPFRYLPEEAGNDRQFKEFLASSWESDPDYQEKVMALQEALCATLFGIAPTYQRVFLLHGAPGTGKSQLLKIAGSLVPDDARCSVPPHQWHDRFMPAMMADKLINICGELPEKRPIAGDTFKDVVDGTERAGQHKNKPIFYFEPKCAHWFASNHYPVTSDTSGGFNRRWLVLSFNRPVPMHERKLDLGDIIVAEEREAIVAWAVQAMKRLKERREYTLPGSHRRAIHEISVANNNVRFFLTESQKIRLGSGNTAEKRVYDAYWSFCVGPGGSKPVNSRDFRSKMRELAIELGFEMVFQDTEFGGQVVHFEGLELMEKV